MPRKTSEARRAAVPVYPGGGTAVENLRAVGDDHAGTWPVRYEAVVRSYLTQLVGPELARPAVQRALAELAGPDDHPGATDLGAVRRVAQNAGFDALDAEVHTFGRRIARTLAGNRKCGEVARHLRQRAQGQISAANLGSFYRHLDTCLRCAEIVGRSQAADWYLEVNLGSATRPGSSGSGAASETRSRAHENGAAEAAWTPNDAPASELGAIPVRSGKSAARRRRGRRGLAVVGVVIAGVVIVAALLAFKPSTVSDGGRGSAQTATTDLARTYGTGTPFEVAGARFAVFVAPRQRWTTFAKTVSPGAGKRWLLVTVSVRNLTRPGLDPTKLQYRLSGPGGVSYVPNPAYGTGPEARGAIKPIAPGTLAQAESAFQVPSAAAGLKLVFDASGPQKQVAVPVGQ